MRRRQMIIWNRAYRPFLFGNPHTPVKAEIEEGVSDPILIDKGIFVRVVTSPSGKTFIVECETGAVVGNDLEVVREDIQTGDPIVIGKQIEDAQKLLREAQSVTPEEFWRLMRAL